MKSKKEMTLNDLEDLLFELDEDALTITELHGFLSAIIVGPAPVMPFAWLGRVFNDEGTMPHFTTKKQAEQVFGLLMGFNNEIVISMDNDTYEPIFDVFDKAGKEVVDPKSWCTGFLNGIYMNKAWYGKMDNALASLLTPIYYFVNEKEMKNILGVHTRTGKKEMETKMLESIPKAVIGLRNYWREKAGAAPKQKTARIIPFEGKAAQETKRNAPCPCGSGKKFKNCCGKYDGSGGTGKGRSITRKAQRAKR